MYQINSSDTSPSIVDKYHLMRSKDCSTRYPTEEFEVQTGECRVDVSKLTFDKCRDYQGFREGNQKSSTHTVTLCESQRLPDPVNARVYKPQQETIRKELEAQCDQLNKDQVKDVTVYWKLKGKSQYMGRLTELYPECPKDPYAPNPCDDIKPCGVTTPAGIPTDWKHYGNTLDNSFNAPNNYCSLHVKGEVSSSSSSFDQTTDKKESNSYCIHTWHSKPYGGFHNAEASTSFQWD